MKEYSFYLVLVPLLPLPVMSFLSSGLTVVSQTLGRQGRNGEAPGLNAHVPCEACQTPSPRGVISQINVYSVLRRKEEVRKPQVGVGGWGGVSVQEGVLALLFNVASPESKL